MVYNIGEWKIGEIKTLQTVQEPFARIRESRRHFMAVSTEQKGKIFMNIPSARQLREDTRQRLAQAPAARNIVLIYTAIVLGLAAVSTTAQYMLDGAISNTGGLGSMHLRTLLSTVNTILPIVQFCVTACLGLGFSAAALRIARGQFVSPRTLKAGLERFWLLLRCTLLQTLIYLAVGIGSFYVSMAVFMFSPFSEDFVSTITPLIAGGSVLNGGVPQLNPATAMVLMGQLRPLMIIFGLLFMTLTVLLTYRYRMVNYVILDRPDIGSFAALRASRVLMQGNKMRLFRVDLSFWWYYLLLAAAAVLAYGDVVLSLLGVSLPLSGTVSYFLFFALSLIADFAVYYFALAKVEVTYAGAYDAIVPRQQPTDGVVLGNIFDLAKQQGDL